MPDPGDDGPRDGARRQGQRRARAGDAGSAPAVRRRTTVQASELKPGQERKELEGVFVVRDGKAVFEPVKTGIAGEKYFEVPSGLKEGDSVIVGPFASVRTLADGAAVKVEQAPRATGANSDNELFPRVGDDRAAGDLGEQAPLVPDRARQHRGRHLDHCRGVAHPGHERLRQRHHRFGRRRRQLHDSAHADRADGSRRGTGAEQSRASRSTTRPPSGAISDNVGAVAAQSQSNASLSYGNETVDGVQVRGVTRDYIYFSTFDVERGRLISPAEVDSSRPVTVIGWDVADKLFGPVDPLDKMVKIGPLHHRVVGVSKKKGSAFGNSQDNFAVIPFGTFRKMFGARPFGVQLLVRPKSPELVQAAMDDATVAMRIERRLRPKRAGQLRDVLLRHAARHLPDGNGRHLRHSRRRRLDVARGRRHRDHEHHADGGQRADPRDRAAQGARRAAPRHHVPDPHRVGHALDVWRRGRHAARLRRSPRSSAS